MRIVGSSVDMNYGCSDSGATTADIVDALEADYEYADVGSASVNSLMNICTGGGMEDGMIGILPGLRQVLIMILIEK